MTPADARAASALREPNPGTAAPSTTGDAKARSVTAPAPSAPEAEKPNALARVREHVSRRWTSSACARCGSRRWAGHGPAWLGLTDEGGRAHLAVFALVCEACGSIELLHAGVVELRLREAELEPPPEREPPPAEVGGDEGDDAPRGEDAAARVEEPSPAVVEALLSVRPLAPLLLVALAVLGLLGGFLALLAGA